MLTRRRFRLFSLFLVIALETLVITTSSWIAIASRGRVVEPTDLPDGAPRTLIVLGAKVEDREAGDYVRARLDVAVDLYRQGRIDRILSSGNNSDDAGNEVTVMREYLVDHGVPAGVIVDDPLGLNTAATCRRAASEFGITEALIVTQNFHAGRAVMLCDAFGVAATGVIAPCGHCSLYSKVRNHFREALLSRPRAVFDALRHSNE
ncbi:MAG: YdcF family protein [Gordonia sp. (in: high G+C Gram-positive bacteria)]|nr:YdcF family protein [Gordonia sp. (in: high G+C Gram-positive bacteria)]